MRVSKGTQCIYRFSALTAVNWLLGTRSEIVVRLGATWQAGYLLRPKRHDINIVCAVWMSFEQVFKIYSWEAIRNSKKQVDGLEERNFK